MTNSILWLKFKFFIFLFLAFFWFFGYKVLALDIYSTTKDRDIRRTSWFYFDWANSDRSLPWQWNISIIQYLSDFWMPSAVDWKVPWTYTTRYSLNISDNAFWWQESFFIASPVEWVEIFAPASASFSNFIWWGYPLPYYWLDDYRNAGTGYALQSANWSWGEILPNPNTLDRIVANYSLTTMSLWWFQMQNQYRPLLLYWGSTRDQYNISNSQFWSHTAFFRDDWDNRFRFYTKQLNVIYLPDNYIGIFGDALSDEWEDRIWRVTVRPGTQSNNYASPKEWLYFRDLNHWRSYYMQIYSGTSVENPDNAWISSSRLCPYNWDASNIRWLVWVYPNSLDWTWFVEDWTAIPFMATSYQNFNCSSRQDVYIDRSTHCETAFMAGSWSTFNCVMINSNDKSYWIGITAKFDRLFGSWRTPPTPIGTWGIDPNNPCVSNPNAPWCSEFSTGFIPPSFASWENWHPKTPDTIMEAMDNLSGLGLKPEMCKVWSSYTGMWIAYPWAVDYFNWYIYGEGPAIAQFLFDNPDIYYNPYWPFEDTWLNFNQLIKYISDQIYEPYPKTLQYWGYIVVNTIPSDLSIYDLSFYCYWDWRWYDEDTPYWWMNWTAPNANWRENRWVNEPRGSWSNWNSINILMGWDWWTVLSFGLLSLFIIQSVNILVRRPKL